MAEKIECPDCHGQGWYSVAMGTDFEDCATCNRTGQVFKKPADQDLEGLGYTPYEWGFHGLAHAIDSRAVDIDPAGKLGGLFFAVEFGGEAGEALNKVKKLEREALGIAGSRTTVEELGDEIADTIITAFNLAREYDIDLEKHVRDVFNRTSELRGLRQRL